MGYLIPVQTLMMELRKKCPPNGHRSSERRP